MPCQPRTLASQPSQDAIVHISFITLTWCSIRSMWLGKLHRHTAFPEPAMFADRWSLDFFGCCMHAKYARPIAQYIYHQGPCGLIIEVDPQSSKGTKKLYHMFQGGKWASWMHPFLIKLYPYHIMRRSKKVAPAGLCLLLNLQFITWWIKQRAHEILTTQCDTWTVQSLCCSDFWSAPGPGPGSFSPVQGRSFLSGSQSCCTSIW